MRKNNSSKSKNGKGKFARENRRRTSIPSAKANNVKATSTNGFDIPVTSGKSSTWNEFLRQNPEAEKLFDKAMELKQDGQAPAAVEMLLALTRDYPDQVPILWYLGGLFQYELKQPKKAIPFFRRATRLSPKSERASLGLFHSLWSTDQFDEALEEIKRFQILTDWSCKDYLKIMDEIEKKWLDEVPRKTKTKQ